MMPNVTREIITLAAARRGEEFAVGLQDAFGKARHTGADYTWACRHACQLIFADGSSPQELVDAAQKPFGPAVVVPADPETVDATIAAMKARAEEARLAGKERERLAAEAAREAEASL